MTRQRPVQPTERQQTHTQIGATENITSSANAEGKKAQDFVLEFRPVSWKGVTSNGSLLSECMPHTSKLIKFLSISEAVKELQMSQVKPLPSPTSGQDP